MRRTLTPTFNGVNKLRIFGVTLIDLDEVDSWMFAFDMSQSERNDACRQILCEGVFMVCNIENRVEMECRI